MSALHAALAYRAAGLSVLPTSGKEPDTDLLWLTARDRGWKRLRDRPAAEEEIVRWYEEDPDAGVGIITGQPSGVAVADIEGRFMSDDLDATLRSVGSPLATTPSGGRHLYLGLAEPLASRRLSGLGDLRADGGYVVAPSGRPDRAWLTGPGAASLVPITHVSTGNQLSFLEPPRGSHPLRGIEPLRGIPGDVEQPSLEDLAAWDAFPPYIEAMRVLLGISAPVGVKFSCILPGHQPDRTPSACLSPAPDTGHVLYRCWQTDTSYTLAHVYYSLVAGKPIETLPWSDETHVLWKVRCLLDGGQIQPPPVLIPSMATNADRLVIRHLPAVVTYFQTRALIKMGIPAPFVPAFVGPWCGIGVDAAKELRHQLRRAKVIREVGRWKTMNLYELGPGS